jgi:dUTP pyrophosphatase
MKMQVVFEKTHPDAKLPTKATEGSACFDIYSVEEAIVEFGKVTVVDCGFKVRIPPGYEIVVRPRSGLAFKHGITIVNAPGTIDEDYRGPIKVALSSVNSYHSKGSSGSHNPIFGPAGKLTIWDNRFKISKGDRIAQIALKKVEDYEFVEGSVDNDTERGEGGYGSTGR